MAPEVSMQLVCSEVPVPVGSFGVVVTEETVTVPKKVHDLLVASGITKGEDVYHVLVRPGAARVIERHLGWSPDECAAAVAELSAVLPEALRVIPPYVARGGALPEKKEDCDLVRRVKNRARFPRDGDDEPRGQGGSGTDEAW